MKTLKHGIFGILAIFALAFAFFACDDGKDTHTHEWEWKVTTYATYNTNGLETETCKTCGATNGTRIIAHPSPIEFTASFDFQFADERLVNVTIQDKRTSCGNQNLEELGIITIIEEEIMGAFNGAFPPPIKANFRNVFGDGVTIIVNNPTTHYKINATDNKTIYFHINYLQSNSADIQQEIRDAVSAMNTGGNSLPYYVE